MQSRFALRFLFWEGAFAMAYETWIGPTYLSGVAGELGVSVGWVGLLAAVPAIGSVGQVLSLWLFSKSSTVKGYVLRLATVARLLWAIPIGLAWIWGVQSYLHGTPFPASRWFLLTAICSCISSVIGSSSGVVWMSWVRDLVPSSFRGRFFGLKQRYTMAAVVAAHAAACFWVGWRPGGVHLGYGVLLILALICAALSTSLLGRVPDVRRGDRTRESLRPGNLLEPLRHPRFGSLILFGAVFNGAMQLAGPYFPYYFTKELHLSMTTISFWTVLTHLGWFAASVGWGKCADGNRRLGKRFWIALHLIALSPAFYIFGGAEWALRIGPLDYFTNGIFWAGYTLVFTTLLLEACPPGRCVLYYSVFAACNGLAGALGNFLGAELLPVLEPIGGFRALWAAAALLRLSVIWTMYPLLFGGKIRLRLRPLPSTVISGPGISQA